MNVRFNIKYLANYNSSIYLIGSCRELGNWDIKKAVRLDCFNNENWEVLIHLIPEGKIYYKFFLGDNLGNLIKWEHGKNRILNLQADKQKKLITVNCSWKEENSLDDILNSAAIKTICLDNTPIVKVNLSPIGKSKTYLNFKVSCSRLLKGDQLFLAGNINELGNWNIFKSLKMERITRDTFEVRFKLPDEVTSFEYKYLIKNSKSDDYFYFESGANREFDLPNNIFNVHEIIDFDFRYTNINIRSAGVALPVFSLRSKRSFGVGEFEDLKLFVDWCSKTDLKIIQILPVNDTILTHSWIDSYPYSCISIFALHPIYLNLKKIGDLPPALSESMIDTAAAKLNSLECIDYEKVMEFKIKYAKQIFDQNKKTFLANSLFLEFFEKNKQWLVPYAAYSYLRDKYQDYNYFKWPAYSNYDPDEILKLSNSKSESYNEIAFFYFLQFHLDRQLSDAVNYAREKGVVLKGDIPIGVNKFGVDTWFAPDLFHMDGQAGAPPDSYALDGQNWLFPTYNWERMQEDGFTWWKNRFIHLSKYFDAIRIDHILGFFRIWEIPSDAVSGLLGHFRPAEPISEKELSDLNIVFNKDRFCKPYIKNHYLNQMLDGEYIKSNFLTLGIDENYYFKDEYNSQQKIKNYFSSLNTDSSAEKLFNEKIKNQLFALFANVIFLEDSDKPNNYHPRIELFRTNSYNELDNISKEKIYNIYIDYFYKRQESLWEKQAMIKLPALVGSSDMLICAEDLGMVPACVSSVMKDLDLLGLYIQRMPADPKLKFGIPQNYNYLSVCTPSCHDMSTIRGWWEEDRTKTQDYYNNILGYLGEAPTYCEPWLCEEIIKQHLNSPSMLAIFPIQDLLGIDGTLRRKNVNDEKINDPEITPYHYWRYRFHINLEDLINEQEFNTRIQGLVNSSGRNLVQY